MSRICELSALGVLYGHKVSHSEIKTNRRFEPNLHVMRFKSDLTGKKYKLRITARALRSIDKLGGFDHYMIKVKNSILSISAKQIKKEILNRLEVNKKLQSKNLEALQ